MVWKGFASEHILKSLSLLWLFSDMTISKVLLELHYTLKIEAITNELFTIYQDYLNEACKYFTEDYIISNVELKLVIFFNRFHVIRSGKSECQIIKKN